MKKMIGLAVLLAIGGCKGKDGVAGAPGASFSSSMVNRNGPVTSDSIAVTIPGLNISRGDILAVYTCINTACVQVNIYQPGLPNNVFYIAQGTTVTISDALTGGQNLWYITALEKI